MKLSKIISEMRPISGNAPLPLGIEKNVWYELGTTISDKYLKIKFTGFKNDEFQIESENGLKTSFALDVIELFIKTETLVKIEGGLQEMKPKSGGHINPDSEPKLGEIYFFPDSSTTSGWAEYEFEGKGSISGTYSFKKRHSGGYYQGTWVFENEFFERLRKGTIKKRIHETNFQYSKPITKVVKNDPDSGSIEWSVSYKPDFNGLINYMDKLIKKYRDTIKRNKLEKDQAVIQNFEYLKIVRKELVKLVKEKYPELLDKLFQSESFIQEMKPKSGGNITPEMVAKLTYKVERKINSTKVLLLFYKYGFKQWVGGWQDWLENVDQDILNNIHQELNELL